MLEINLKLFVDKDTVPSILGTSLKPFVNTCTLTLTFAVGTNSEWKPMNRDSQKAKALNSSNTDSPGSTSNELDHLRKNTSQQEQIIRLTGQINIVLINDKKNLLPDLLNKFQHREMLFIKSKHNSPMTHHRF